MKKQILSLAIVCVGIIVTGCANDFGSPVNQDQKAAVEVGKTTRIQVLQELGNPDQKIDLGNNREQFSYIKEHVQPTAGAFIGKAPDSSYTEFWIVFENGIVVDKGERPTTKQPNYFK